MIKQFLSAQHWQLFVLMFGVPMVFQFIFLALVYDAVNQDGALDPIIFFMAIKWVPWMVLLFLTLFFGWLYSIVIGLQHKIPIEHRFNTRRFKILLLIPLVYLVSFVFFFSSLSDTTFLMLTVNITPLVVIILLHLFAVFCTFYCIIIAAKTIKSIELQRKAKGDEYIKEFILILFYMVGIWIIQPKINQIAEEDFK